jgi:hypothetical protein
MLRTASPPSGRRPRIRKYGGRGSSCLDCAPEGAGELCRAALPLMIVRPPNQSSSSAPHDHTSDKLDPSASALFSGRAQQASSSSNCLRKFASDMLQPCRGILRRSVDSDRPFNGKVATPLKTSFTPRSESDLIDTLASAYSALCRVYARRTCTLPKIGQAL